MPVLLIESNNRVIRVREEEDGCVFFFDNLYVEGDMLTYKILQLISEGQTIGEVVETLLQRYDIDRETVLNDLIQMFKKFEPCGIFQEFVAELITLKEAAAS